MIKKEIKHDLKKVVKNWMNGNGYKVFIKDIQDVKRHGTNTRGGMDHKVIYTILLKNGTAYEIEIETRAGGVYSETSGKYELVKIDNIIW